MVLGTAAILLILGFRRLVCLIVELFLRDLTSICICLLTCLLVCLLASLMVRLVSCLRCLVTMLVLRRLLSFLVLAFLLLEQVNILRVLRWVVEMKLVRMVMLVLALLGKFMTMPSWMLVLGCSDWTCLSSFRNELGLLNWCTFSRMLGVVRRKSRLKQGIIPLAEYTVLIRLGCSLVGRRQSICIYLTFLILVRLLTR